MGKLMTGLVTLCTGALIITSSATSAFADPGDTSTLNKANLTAVTNSTNSTTALNTAALDPIPNPCKPSSRGLLCVVGKVKFVKNGSMLISRYGARGAYIRMTNGLVPGASVNFILTPGPLGQVTVQPTITVGAGNTASPRVTSSGYLATAQATFTKQSNKRSAVIAGTAQLGSTAPKISRLR